MAYEALKALIRQYIKPNEQEEITGAVLQGILLEMVNQLGVAGNYLPLTGGNITGNVTVSSNPTATTHNAVRLAQSGVTIENIASVGLNEVLGLSANSITYQSYFPNATPSTMTVSFGMTGITLTGGITASSFVNSSVEQSVRGNYLLKADGNVVSISDIGGGVDMSVVWESLADDTNEQIASSHLTTALSAYATITQLGNYLPLTGGTLTGDLTVYNSEAYVVKVAGKTATTTSLAGGSITIETATSGTPIKAKSHLGYNELYFSNQDVKGTTITYNSVTSDSFIKSGGTSAQFLKADGSVDSNAYITASALTGYATQSWVNNKLGDYLPLDGGTLTGTLNFTNTYGNGSIFIDSVDYDLNITASNMIYLDAVRGVGINGNVTATSFIKNGGTSAQFLKADGSVDSNAYLPLTGGTMDKTATITFPADDTTSAAESKINFMAGRFYFDRYGNFNFGNITATQTTDYWHIDNKKTNKELFRVGYDGNVGIGVTSAPSYKLYVNGSFNATSIYENGTLLSSKYNPTSNFKTINGNSIIGTGDISVGGGSGNYLPLTGGTMDKSATIAFSSDMTGTYAFKKLTFADNFFIDVYGNYIFDTTATDSNYWNVGKRVGTTDTYMFTVHHNGNVGINTTSPSYKLHVNGTAGITGNLTVNGNLKFAYDRGIDFGNNSVRIKRDNSRLLIINEDGDDIIIGDYGDSNYTSIVNDLQGGTTNSTYSKVTQKWLITYDGDAYFKSVSQTSDLRKKTIMGDVPMNIYNVANAPLFKFTWNDEKKYSGQHVGSAAQYWQTVLPELVSIGRDADMTLAMQYDVIALASAITVAKTVVNHEERIKVLENENKSLKEEIELLKNKS